MAPVGAVETVVLTAREPGLTSLYILAAGGAVLRAHAITKHGNARRTATQHRAGRRYARAEDTEDNLLSSKIRM